MIGIIQTYWQALLYSDGYRMTGLAMTLWLLVISCGIGFCLAVPLAVLRNARNPLLWFPVWLYTFLFRGTPLYVQLLLIYTGIYGLDFIHNTAPFNEFFRQGLNCTILSFALNTGAYTTEIFAGSIKRDLAWRGGCRAGHGHVPLHAVPAHHHPLGAAPRPAGLQQ